MIDDLRRCVYHKLDHLAEGIQHLPRNESKMYIEWVETTTDEVMALMEATDSPTPSPLDNEHSASQKASPSGPPDRELLTTELMTKHFTDQVKDLTIVDYNGKEVPLLDYLLPYLTAQRTALLQRVREEVIGPNTHIPLFEDRPNGPHVMETEKNEFRAAQRAVLDNIIGGKK